MKKCFVSRDWFLILSLIVLAAAVIAVVVVRIQAAPAPLERDEGEYALMGQLILDGVPPYGEAANMKFPGIYYAYSAILALFGQTASGIHLGLLVVNLLSTLLLYLLARPMLGAAGAALAGAAFIITSADDSVLGLFAHATQFVVMFAIAGTWLLLKIPQSERRMPLLWASGVCFGLAFLMKQSGVFFPIFGLLWFCYETFRSRPISWKRFFFESGSLAGGIALPGLLVILLMAAQGVFDRFWFWTVDYARAYVSEVNLRMGLELFRLGFFPIFKNNPAIWTMAFLGLAAVWFTGFGRKIAPFLLAFFLFSFLSVCPGFFFRQHYFVQLLPAAALCAGAAVAVLEQIAAAYTDKSKILQFLVVAVVAGVSLIGVLSTGRVLAALTPERFSRSIYGGNPFPESERVAEYIKKNTGPEDRIAIIGSEPQICFYAHRRSATEHIYMYGLMEVQPYALRMQNEMIEQVEKNRPPYLVLVTVPTSWLRQSGSEQRLFSWLGDYIGRYYQPVLIADIYADRTLWISGKEAEPYRARQGADLVVVFKRKAGR